MNNRIASIRAGRTGVGPAALALLALMTAVLVAPVAAQAQTADPPTVVVLVIDGLLPEEIGATTPNIQALKDTGTWYEESRSVLLTETIPNHVAMMTGVYPEQSNIPANAFWDRDESTPEGRDLSDPAELSADTLFTTLDRSCPDIGTASILSKTYLYEIFETGGQNVQADTHWEPGPIIPESGHTPDTNTMTQVVPALADHDFVFVNLGDVDRSGHVDITAGLFEVPADLGVPSLPSANNTLARQAVLRNTDLLIGVLVQELRNAGRWDETVLFVVSDHGMDWSDPLGFVDVQTILDGVEADRYVAVINGAAQTVYLRNPGQPDDAADLAAARAAILAAIPDAVAHAWYVQPNPADPAPDTVVPDRYRIVSPNSGDLILIAADGWRFAGASPQSNPIPGNHGHLVTRHNTFLVSGGHPDLASPSSVAAPAEDPDHIETFDNQSENVDVAPTVAWLFGLPTDRYQGRVLREAFASGFAPASCAAAETAPVAATTTAPPPEDNEPEEEPLPATGSDRTRSLVLAGFVISVVVVARWFRWPSWRRTPTIG